MTAFDPSDSPVETAADAIGPAATRSFKLLGNQTRLGILLALWDDYEPFGDDNALSFSELLDRVDYDTSSNFSYHLEKLQGHYVASTDDGYRLTAAGHKIVRAVIAGAGISDASLEPTEIDLDCWYCGDPVAITYENGHLYTICRGCGGKFVDDGEAPSGVLMGFTFDPAGLSRPSPEAIFTAMLFRAMQKFTMQMGGLCPDCSGPVDASIHRCEDHRAGEICPNCDRAYEVQVRWVCTVCKNAGHAPPAGNMVLHPRVVAFYAERGLDVGYASNDFDTMTETLQAMADHEAEVVSTDPPRLRVTVRYAGDELRLTVDESLTVIAVDE